MGGGGAWDNWAADVLTFVIIPIDRERGMGLFLLVMNQNHYLVCARFIVLAIGVWLAGGKPAWASWPGDVLAAAPVDVAALGRIAGSAVAADGSVLLQGDFTRVDGIERPGLAKLLADGRLDTTFQPEAVAISGAAALPGIMIFGTPASGSFVVLHDGTWVWSALGHPLAYRPNGTLDPRYAFLSGEHGAGDILFETDTSLFLFREHPEGRRLEAFLRDTFEPQPLNALGSWPKPAIHVVPAADGGLWVCGGDAYDPLILGGWLRPPLVLFRVGGDGERDPLFTPRELGTGREYQMESRRDGGFRLVHWNAQWLGFTPVPSARCCVIDDYDAHGVLIASRTMCIPWGIPLLLAEEADGSLIHNVAEMHDGQYVHALVRCWPDGARDPDFRVPLEAFTLQLLPDGRIHHSHIRRVLSDGSPDPAWQPPAFTADPAVTAVGVFADGGILVNRHHLAGNPAPSSLIVLDADLQPDPLFNPPADLPAALSYHMAHDRMSVLVALRGIYEFPDETRTRILRLGRDGAVDPDSPRYLPLDGTIFFVSPDHDPVLTVYSGPFNLHALTGGAMLVHYMLPDREVPSFVLARLLADGTPDPAFSFSGGMGMLPAIFVLSDGSFIVNKNHFAPDGTSLGGLDFPQYGTPMAELPGGRIALRYYAQNIQQLAIWDFESGVDPNFRTAFLDGTWIHQVIPLPDGAWIVKGNLRIPAGSRSLVRLYGDGRIDPTFIEPVASRTLPAFTGLLSVVRSGVLVEATHENRMRPARMDPLELRDHPHALLVAGDFTELNEQPRAGLGLVSLQHVDTFHAWREHLLEGGDEEDASEHLEDYATGVDPADATRALGWHGSSGVSRAFFLSLNPHATDVAIEWEASADLISWREVLPGELEISPEPHRLRVDLPGAAPFRFLRVRYRLDTTLP